MTITSLGDQSQLFQTRRQNTRLKSDLERLTREMTSGRLMTPRTGSSGDVSQLFAIERSLKALAGYATATIEAGTFLGAVQDSLGVLQDSAQGAASAAIAAGASGTPTQLSVTAGDARGRLVSAIATLNGSQAGRSLFAGTATDGAALAPADDILSALETAIAGETTADGVATVIEDWFTAPGGGFETVGYRGAPEGLGFRVAAGETVGPGVTAEDLRIRATLAGLAMAAMVGDSTLSGNTVEQARLASRAGNSLLAADAGMSNLRAEVGTSEAMIEANITHQSAEKTSLELAEAKYAAADPYETASKLQEVTSQLETLYAVTARLSNLSLTEFLR